MLEQWSVLTGHCPRNEVGPPRFMLDDVHLRHHIISAVTGSSQQPAIVNLEGLQ